MNVLGIFIPILVLFVTIFLVYFIIYKKRINKRLEQDESTAHVSMISSGSVAKFLVIVVAVLFAISISKQISEVASDVQQTYLELENKIQSLSWQINELENELEQQDYPLTSFEYSFGEVNNKDNTVETVFRCVPKTFSEDTVVKIVIGEQTIILEASEDGIFTATKQFPLFAGISSEATVAVTTGGITNTHELYDAPYQAPFEFALPQISGYEFEFGKEAWKNGKVTLSGSFIPVKGDGMTDIKLFFIVDGNVVKTMDSEEQMIDIHETFGLSKNSILELIAEGTDQYGYTHKKELYAFMASEDTVHMNANNYDTITDKNGSVLIEG